VGRAYCPAGSFNAAFSNSAAARNRFSMSFCFSGPLRRFAWSAVKAPYWFRHRSYVCLLTTSSRQTSATSAPSASIPLASPSLGQLTPACDASSST